MRLKNYIVEKNQEMLNYFEMADHFLKRTNLHINLVKKYCQLIIKLNDGKLDNSILNTEMIDHDKSKFIEPEYSPYLHVNWKYYMKDLGQEYNPPENIKKKMHEATFHHIKNNKHHPEYWDDNATIEFLNSKDRDKPADKIVDSTGMPLSHVATMIADWLAMSEEKNTDIMAWRNLNVNKRWKFTKEQVNLIDELLNKFGKME